MIYAVKYTSTLAHVTWWVCVRSSRVGCGFISRWRPALSYFANPTTGWCAVNWDYVKQHPYTALLDEWN